MTFDLKQFLKNQKDTKLVLVPLIDRFFLRTEDLGKMEPEDLALVQSLMEAWQEERRSDRFSPSGSNRCLREQALSILGKPKLPITDPHLISIFDDGNWRHIRWHTIFQRMERAGLLRVKHIEDRIEYPAWFVGGTPDDILEINGVDYVVDIKGSNTDKWGKVKKTGEADMGYVYQVHVYMQAHGINHAIILYENKNDQKYQEVLVNRDPMIIKDLRERYKTLNRARKSKVLPETECTLSRTDLRYNRCPQRLNCVAALNSI